MQANCAAETIMMVLRRDDRVAVAFAMPAKHLPPFGVSLVKRSLMATLMYYFSRDASTCAPPSSELSSIDAESSLAAVYKLKDEGNLPPDWQSLWAHILVWSSQDGKHRGFESIRLADIQELAAA
jgi:hypothetical protein